MTNILEQTNKEEKGKMQKPINSKRLIMIIVVLLIIFVIYLFIKYYDAQKKEGVAMPVAKTEQTTAEQTANLKDLRQKLREESMIKTSATNTVIQQTQQTQAAQTQTNLLNPITRSVKTEPAKPLTQEEMQQQSNTLKALRNKARGVMN